VIKNAPNVTEKPKLNVLNVIVVIFKVVIPALIYARKILTKVPILHTNAWPVKKKVAGIAIKILRGLFVITVWMVIIF
jgi:hypothetical protein